MFYNIDSFFALEMYTTRILEIFMNKFHKIEY